MTTPTTVTLPATMQAIELEANGTPPRVVEKPVPSLGETDVLVQIAAAPINPSDLLFLEGRYGLKKPLPVVPGFEGSGTIVAVGSAWWLRPYLGRRVACGTPDDSDGTWAEYMRTPAMRCIPLSSKVSSVQGATLLVNPLTAWALVELARSDKHAAAIQTAAASSLGLMVVRIANRANLPLINIVRREAQAATLREHGAMHVLNSSDPDFAQQLADMCAYLRPTILLDAVGGALTGQIMAAMPDQSQAVIYGALAGDTTTVNIQDLLFRQQTVRGFWLSGWFAQQGLPGLLRASNRVQSLIGEDFRTTVQAAYPLERIHDAIAHYQRQMSAGKVLLVPGLRGVGQGA